MPLTNPAPGVIVPADHNLLGWTFDPAEVQAGTIMPTAGLLQLARVKVFGTLVTNILIHLTTGGTTLTAGQCFAALFSPTGTLLSATADQSTAWGSGGLKSMALTAPQVVGWGSWPYVGLFANTAGTMPTLSRGLNSSSAILNAGLAAPNFRYASADAALTTAMPASFSAQTGTATAFWVGLS